MTHKTLKLAKLAKPLRKSHLPSLVELFSILATLLLLVLSCIFLSGCLTFRQKYFALPPAQQDFRLRASHDLLIIFLFAGLFFCLRKAFQVAFEARILRHYDHSAADFLLKKEKACRQVFDVVYYSLAYSWALGHLWNSPNLPTAYGGSADCSIMGRKWPHTFLDDQIRWYYMVQMGHHLHNLLVHLAHKHARGNWYELALHHYATIIAMLFTYFTNYEDCGLSVLLAHDVGDIFINLGKALRDAQARKVMIDLAFAAMLLCWVYPRVILISTCTLKQGSYYLFFMPYFYDHKYQSLW